MSRIDSDEPDDSVAGDAENLYTILRCDRDASYEQLKLSYLQLIKEYHPDKQQMDVGTTERSHEEFAKIDRAWKILRDEKSRKEYDACQMQSSLNNRSLIYAELKKDELTFDSDSMAFYPCRCGSEFVIHEDYLIDDECIVECSECSNCIVVK